ncbi:hypothetical protein ACQPZJ_27165 [Actinoplanes sp. CA-054009]
MGQTLLKVMAFLVKKPEIGFADRAAYEQWVSVMYAPGSGVAEEEARFLDRSRTRSYVVDERVTARAGH